MFKHEEGQQIPESERLRILIADDVLETRRSTRLMLTLIPEAEIVAIAQDGRQAVEMAQEYLPDIALIDVNMPEMDGLTAIEKMLQIRPEMACVVISAERDKPTLQKAVAVGAREYLVKPFTSDQLVETIERVKEEVLANRKDAPQTARSRQKRAHHLRERATKYAKSGRIDNKALAVFEELAADPDCELRWLMGLAIIYVFRRRWGKLKVLTERLEQRTNPDGS